MVFMHLSASGHQKSHSLAFCSSGAADSDWLQGDEGADGIFGGTGNDNLVGCLQADRFIDRTYERWNADKIWDWQDGLDKLDFVGTGLSVASFTLTASGGDAIITYNADGDSITVLGAAGLINAADFVF